MLLLKVPKKCALNGDDNIAIWVILSPRLVWVASILPILSAPVPFVFGGMLPWYHQEALSCHDLLMDFSILRIRKGVGREKNII